MTEPLLKTAGVATCINTQQDVPSNAIAPTADVVAEFKQLKTRRTSRFLLLRIEGAQVVVDSSAPPSASFADFMNALPDSDCRYAVYDHEFSTTADPKLFLVTWIPPNSCPASKMAYAQAKPTVRALCEGVLDVDAVCKKQVQRGVGLSDGDCDDQVVELSSPVCFMSFMAF